MVPQRGHQDLRWPGLLLHLVWRGSQRSWQGGGPILAGSQAKLRARSGGLAEGLFAAEKQSQEMVVKPKPSTSPRLKPVTRPKPSLAMAPVAGKKRGYVQADEKPLVLDEGAMQQFMDMLVSIGQHRAGDARALTNFKAIVREVLNRSEPVKRGLQTWQELRLALSGSDDVGVDAHFLAQFARESPAPSRVYHALRWLGRNFPLSMDLALLVPPTRQKGGRYGGGRQAPVVPPPIIHFLDDLLSTAEGSSQWSAVLSAWMMVFGVVRFGHLQRSNLAFWNDTVMVFFCQKGKQLSNREGFFWSIPRWTMGGQSLLEPWLEQEAIIRKCMIKAGRNFHHCAFDLDEGKPLNMVGFLGAVRAHLKMLITNVGDLTSYSFRRVAPTVAVLAERSEVEKTALGSWTDRASNLAASAARYNAQKARLTDQLKVAMLFVLRQLREVDAWHSVSLAMCIREWNSGMEVGDDAMANAGVWTYAKYSIPNMPVIRELTLERAQAVRLRARTFLKRSSKEEVPPLEVAAVAEVSPQVPLPVADRPLVVAPSAQPSRGVPLPKAKAKAGSLPVKAKPAVPRVSPEGAEAAALEAEEFFNREAVKWNRRGNSGNPAPWFGVLPMVRVQFGWVVCPKLLISTSCGTTTSPCWLLLWTRRLRTQVAIVDPRPCSWRSQSATRDVTGRMPGFSCGRSWWLLWPWGSPSGSIAWQECTVGPSCVQQLWHSFSALTSGRCTPMLSGWGTSTAKVSWSDLAALAPLAGLKNKLLPRRIQWRCFCRCSGWHPHAGARHGTWHPITVWEIGSNHIASGGKVLPNLCSRVRSSLQNQSERQCWLSVNSARRAWQQHQQETKPWSEIRMFHPFVSIMYPWLLK